MLTQTIYAHAREMPEKLAIVFDTGKLTYGDFAAAIEASRRFLAAARVGGEGVAVLAIQGIFDGWITGLALRSLGLTTVTARSLEEAAGLGLRETRFVVAMSGRLWPGLDRLCEEKGWRLIAHPEPDWSGGPRRAPPDIEGWPAKLGERILLTSGTTGTYKKTLFDPFGEGADPRRLDVFGISERSVVNVLNFGLWTAIGYNVAANAWAVGGTVVLCEQSQIHATLRYPGITHTIVIPDYLQRILRAPPGELERHDEMCLLVTAGTMSQALFEAARARLTRHIVTSVGATEVGVMTVTRIETPGDLYWHRVVPECEVEVVDDAGRPVPVGMLGQIRVRVADGAIGYLHDEAATREFFHGEYFYTGDLGIYRADGRLALHGRETEVVNVLGYKIAPGPIEARLVDECGVTAACILSSRRRDGVEILHVVLETGERVPEQRLASILAHLLPFTFQAQAHYLAALPRNPMGKIRRDALRRQLGLA